MEQNRPTSPSLTATPSTTEGTDANSTDTACTSSTTPVAPSKQPAISKTVRMLNKNSHKISKHHQHARNSNPRETQNATQPSLPKINGNPPAQPQPPVYNINKNDFRDVVQKLTGSPAHQVTSPSPSSSPPPSTTTTSTRLHKIRPPPLTHINPRPNNPTVTTGNTWMTTPDSPLPPLPTVSLVAESPITTYMRCLNEGSQAQQPLDAPIFTLPTSPAFSDGINLAGTRYIAIRADARSVYGKKGGGGCVCVKTGQCILIGKYDESIQPGTAATVIEKLGDYLIENGC